MSKVVTPPDIIIEEPVYLIINAPVTDIEIISHWLRIEQKDYTIHLYHEGMQDAKWLKEVASKSNRILIYKPNLSTELLSNIVDYVAKIVWFGPEEKYIRSLDFFIKNE